MPKINIIQTSLFAIATNFGHLGLSIIYLLLERPFEDYNMIYVLYTTVLPIYNFQFTNRIENSSDDSNQLVKEHSGSVVECFT